MFGFYPMQPQTTEEARSFCELAVGRGPAMIPTGRGRTSGCPEGTADELRDNEDVKEFYLGGAGDQRRRFKNLKNFKRRKRWL